MQVTFLVASLCSVAAAAQNGAILQPRQFLNTTTSSATMTTTTTPMAPPATTFGAAAAAIQSAIAAGLALKSSASEAAASIPTDTPIAQMSTSTTTTSVTSTSIATVQAAGNVAPAPVPFLTVIPSAQAPVPAPPALPTAAPAPAAGASIGSQGTVTVDGNVYTTAVVASYVTVAAQPTTFYENGIAYVASYAGETITVSNCPCTRSASIVFATTTVCSACDGATATSPAMSFATDESGATVVFTGAAPRSQAAGLQTLIIGGIVVVVAGLFM